MSSKCALVRKLAGRDHTEQTDNVVVADNNRGPRTRSIMFCGDINCTKSIRVYCDVLLAHQKLNESNYSVC